MSLPVFPCDFLVWVSPKLGKFWYRCTICGIRERRRGGRIVRFENFEPFELLVEYSERLELLRLGHLRLEPRLDFILFFLNQVLVNVVQMSARVLDGM